MNKQDSESISENSKQEEEQEEEQQIEEPVNFKTIQDANKGYLSELFEQKKARREQEEMKFAEIKDEIVRKDTQIRYWKQQCFDVYEKEAKVMQKNVKKKDKEIQDLQKLIEESNKKIKELEAKTNRQQSQIKIFKEQVRDHQVFKDEKEQETKQQSLGDKQIREELRKMKIKLQQKDEHIEALNQKYKDLQKKYYKQSQELEVFQNRRARAISLKNSINKPSSTFSNLNQGKVSRILQSSHGNTETRRQKIQEAQQEMQERELQTEVAENNSQIKQNNKSDRQKIRSKQNSQTTASTLGSQVLPVCPGSQKKTNSEKVQKNNSIIQQQNLQNEVVPMYLRALEEDINELEMQYKEIDQQKQSFYSKPLPSKTSQQQQKQQQPENKRKSQTIQNKMSRNQSIYTDTDDDLDTSFKFKLNSQGELTTSQKGLSKQRMSCGNEKGSRTSFLQQQRNQYQQKQQNQRTRPLSNNNMPMYMNKKIQQQQYQQLKNTGNTTTTKKARPQIQSATNQRVYNYQQQTISSQNQKKNYYDMSSKVYFNLKQSNKLGDSKLVRQISNCSSSNHLGSVSSQNFFKNNTNANTIEPNSNNDQIRSSTQVV